ncbi:hypothetical protein DYH09_22715 [bacterium CPR1]|nr:hypothetical protein [bacterium CPR1]
MALSQDLKEFLQLLEKHHVEYLVVGGFAVAAHGHPRYTKDLDLWIRQTESNAQRLVECLREFGFESLGLQVSDFLEPDVVVQLGHPPNRIDLLTRPDGVLFEECYPKKVRTVLEGVSVDIIDLESLRVNKQASGRHQDLADLENLQGSPMVPLSQDET